MSETILLSFKGNNGQIDLLEDKFILRLVTHQ